MADDGATPREQLFEACRRNNTSLLTELLSEPPLRSNTKQIATFLNTTVNTFHANALHIAAQYGSYDVLDMLLDQDGVEIDGQERREGDTALHAAVRWCNGLPAGDWPERGQSVIDILLDAGCDPRIRNKAKLRPIELLDSRNTTCRDALRRAEVTLLAGADIVDDDAPGDGNASESD